MTETNFKHTDLGLIPHDWEVKTLRSIIDECNYGVGAEAIKYNGDVKYLRITDIDDESHHYSPKPLTSPAFYSECHLAKSGDLFVARTGASVGKSYLYNSKDGKLVYAGFLIKVHISEANPYCVFLNTLTQRYNNWVISESARTGQPGLNAEQLKTLLIPLPPTLAEQERIAGALSSIDTLIGALTEQIEKKRHIKQGAMQKLLSLPSIEPVLLDDIVKAGDIKLYRGKVISKKDIEQCPGDYPIYSSSVQNEGLMGCYGKYMFEEEMISWSVDGGGNFFYRPKHRFSITNVSGYMRINTNKYDYKFLAYLLQFEHAKKIFDYQTKAHPSVIRKAYELRIPASIEEQKSIASVLSNMDTEIAALEQKRDKYIAIKSGMMQNLLTGKIRLV